MTAITAVPMTEFEIEVLDALRDFGPVYVGQRQRPVEHQLGFDSSVRGEVMRALRQFALLGLAVATSNGRNVMNRKGKAHLGCDTVVYNAT